MTIETDDDLPFTIRLWLTGTLDGDALARPLLFMLAVLTRPACLAKSATEVAEDKTNPFAVVLIEAMINSETAAGTCSCTLEKLELTSFDFFRGLKIGEKSILEMIYRLIEAIGTDVASPGNLLRRTSERWKRIQCLYLDEFFF